MPPWKPPVEWTSLGLDPVALTLGPLAIRWYSLAYIAGILLGWRLLRVMLRRPGAPMQVAHVDDLVGWCTLGVILGGRLAYVVFYDPATFLAEPLRILKIWEGGMAFHGGFLGVILAIVLYGRARGLALWRVLDYVAVVAPLGLFLGRLANFVNGELWGRPTDGSWGVVFPGAGPEPRHPSQLYEATLEGLVLFVVLNLLFWRTEAHLRPGLLGGLFVLLYGLFRFAVEFVREPDPQLGVLALGLTMGQTLSLPMILFGLWHVAMSFRRPPPPALSAA
ncbi:MAG: prolipoprotein diacylglyceryl transferase [Sphingomonadaceae bacterium]|uniref:prolipoprotein diacylglyceryl transferase n=1 Tax=Thermaurantiacus sp. TaxID=2820283 RepID=UPI00298F1041|nr:prolipoprotein diacylglyceryl transferase [Thermaurantiacus sp.]MCS6987643.1 prolipoprotein diacylglyceryl transferase [Sphingomonadaceae bacterium]MDW8415244.1 prolipoprotein diacylglyceryl transferase [Thermaurantiacus sp.]